MRILLVLGSALAVWWASAAPAAAHGADSKAFLAFESPSLVPGTHDVIVELLDFYDNRVPKATVRVEVSIHGASTGLRTNLSEGHPGTYVGQLALPGPGRIDLRVEALLPDGPWRGGVKLVTGGTARAHRTIGLALRHADAPLVTPLGVVVLVLISLVVVGSVGAFTIDTYRHAGMRS